MSLRRRSGPETGIDPEGSFSGSAPPVDVVSAQNTESYGQQPDRLQEAKNELRDLQVLADETAQLLLVSAGVKTEAITYDMCQGAKFGGIAHLGNGFTATVHPKPEDRKLILGRENFKPVSVSYSRPGEDPTNPDKPPIDEEDIARLGFYAILVSRGVPYGDAIVELQEDVTEALNMRGNLHESKRGPWDLQVWAVTTAELLRVTAGVKTDIDSITYDLRHGEDSGGIAYLGNGFTVRVYQRNEKRVLSLGRENFEPVNVLYSRPGEDPTEADKPPIDEGDIARLGFYSALVSRGIDYGMVVGQA